MRCYGTAHSGQHGLITPSDDDLIELPVVQQERGCFEPSRDNEFYRDAFIKARLQPGSSHAAHDTVTV